MRPAYGVILAGGRGTRMGPGVPKVLRPVAEVPMIVYLVGSFLKAHLEELLIIIPKGHDGKEIQQTIQFFFPEGKFHFVQQEEPLGSGNAVTSAYEFWLTRDPEAQVLIACGDAPLIDTEIIQRVAQIQSEALMLVSEEKCAEGRARVLPGGWIREEKDASVEEKQIKVVNHALMSFQIKTLVSYLPRLTNNNASREYYLTQIFNLRCQDRKENARYWVPQSESWKLHGINSMKDKYQVEARLALIRH